MAHQALPTWADLPERGRRADPRTQRLDEGLHDMWEKEDHSVEDLDRIREMTDS